MQGLAILMQRVFPYKEEAHIIHPGERIENAPGRDCMRLGRRRRETGWHIFDI